MDTLPLPPRPDLEQYRKRAKSLVAAANSADPDAVRSWAADWIRALAKLIGVEITPFIQHSFDRVVSQLESEVRARGTKSSGLFTLADAQHLVARAHSYETWATFATEVKSLQTGSWTSDFERAADAIVNGDLSTLDALLERTPDLIRARSQRTHHVTLLHYIAANGVEDFRQKTPPNAVEVAQRLLVAGAEVDANSDTYGGGPYQTPMNLLVSSEHPAEAGLQSALVEVLLDHGAAVDGPLGNSTPILTALAFGYLEAAETLARRGARMEHVIIAAAIGRMDLVRQWVVNTDTLATPASRQELPYWVHIPDGPKAQIEMALVWACRFARTEVARFLLDKGVDPAAKDHDRQSALHWASALGLMEVIELLLARGAPLEVRNVWGGTVLDSTVYFAMRSPYEGVDYPVVIDRLLAAGADIEAVDPRATGIPAIDAVLERYRDS